MDAVICRGKREEVDEPASKHQIQRGCTTMSGTSQSNPSGETKFSGANAYREKTLFPVQLITSRIGSPIWLIHHTLLKGLIHRILKNLNASVLWVWRNYEQIL